MYLPHGIEGRIGMICVKSWAQCLVYSKSQESLVIHTTAYKTSGMNELSSTL